MLTKLDGLNQDISWGRAIDTVNYPVKLVPAFWTDGEGYYNRATGKTPLNRDNEYNFVVTDPLKNGVFKVVSPVTGVYGTLPTDKVYENLREQLNEVGLDYNLRDVFVSENGGLQQLRIVVKGLESIDEIPDTVQMEIAAVTSVDRSAYHGLKSFVWNPNKNVSIQLYGGTYKLHARHTNTISQRVVDFIPSLKNILKNWNETVMPTMKMMCDYKFDRNFAIALIEEIAKDSGLAEKHIEPIKVLYRHDEFVATNDKTDSLYRINVALNQYASETLGKKNRIFSDKVREKIARSVYEKLKKYK